jgi:5-methylcytosine-specific restriction enzyme subunit McrC
LDTKYKASGKLDPADVAQVIAYAELMKTTQAMLVFPGAMAGPFDEDVGSVRVRSLSFSLANDLEEAGVTFLSKLLSKTNKVQTGPQPEQQDVK